MEAPPDEVPFPAGDDGAVSAVPDDAGAPPPVEAPGAVPPRARRGLWITVAAVVVVVVAVLGLSASGLLGSSYDILGSKGNGPSAGTAVSFSQAYAAANASVASVPGSWDLLSVDAIDVPVGSNFSLTADQPNASSPCYVGTPPALADATEADAAAGTSPFWGFSFLSPGNGSVLEVSVVNGQAAVEGATPPGSHCDGPGPLGTLAPEADIEDSPHLTASLPQLGAFLGRYPSSVVLFVLGDEAGEIGRVSGTAAWVVDATPCAGPAGLLGLEPGDPAYSGATNGTTDHVYLDASEVDYGACLVGGRLVENLWLDRSLTDTYSGPYDAYGTKVQAVNSTVTASDLRPTVFPALNASVNGSAFAAELAGLDVENITGAGLASYNFTSGAWTNASLALVTGDSLVLLSTVPLPGAVLVLAASTPVSGEAGFFLP